MEEASFKKVTTILIIFSLIFLTFLILKPILVSILVGFLLAFIFMPVYNFIYKKTKLQNLSATIVLIILSLLIILPIWFFTPIILEQALKFYIAAQQIDFRQPLKIVFPSFFGSAQFSDQIAAVISSFISGTINSFLNYITKAIFNFPRLLLQIVVVFFVMFFSLRDNQRLIEYAKSLLPFPKEIEKRIFDSSKSITISILYGQIIVGGLQGLITGLGYFIFGVPNALLLTLLSIVAGVFPIIGPTVVWIPTAFYLILADKTFAAAGVIIFGLIASFTDNALRPVFVSKRTNVPSSLILIGMIGGLFVFGLIGLILGPLILAYLLIILELYRTKNTISIFQQST